MLRRHPRPPMGPPGLGPPGPGGVGNMRGPPPHLGPRGPPGMGPPPMSGAVSSCTNSNDPASMDSRLFVGNLNTVALNKEDVEVIFSQYGIVSGISLHKGFAFVQFRHPDDARWAGASEDGKTYAGQALDINIVSQPKKRSALKRSNTGKGVNDSPPKKARQDAPVTTNQSLQRTLVTLSNDKTNSVTATASRHDDIKSKAKATDAMKKACTIVSDASLPVSLSTTSTNCSSIHDSAATEYSSADILICGSCKLQFTSLHSLALHKKVPCHLRFSCQCNGDDLQESIEPTLIQCAKCDFEFVSAWALCQHCTEEHQMSIFKSETTEGNKLQNGKMN